MDVTKLRLICLLIAKGNIEEAQQNFHWVNSGKTPLKNRV